MQTIEQITSAHASHLESVSPGLPAEFSSACVPGDCVAQGDLNLTVTASAPKGWKEIKPVRQLAPESGAGSHHRLSSLEGVTMWAPDGWSVDGEWDSLDGPVFVADRDVTVLHEPGHAHPHGPVKVPAGMMIACTYQRELDREERRERRVLD